MGSLYDTLNESVGVSTDCNCMDSVFNMRPIKYKNPKYDDKTYTLHDDDIRGPYVMEERSDGYKSKLRMSRDKFYQFQSLLCQNGWVQV